ncbi:MAG: NHL domain-containing protein [Acidimicrobiales bacterium]
MGADVRVIVDRTATPGRSVLVEAEALIREARRLRRRRRALRFSVVLIVATTAGISYGILSSSDHPLAPSPGTTVAQSRTPTLPTGPTVTLNLAGSLAVGPSGVLYIAAPNEHRILARLANGKFRVVAGTGTAGHSGSGVRAINAQLTDPTNLTFDARGDLYFVDSGRVRVIESDGVIETVAGDGSSSPTPGSRSVATVANGTPALIASFHSEPSIAFGPGGVLYIATDTQLLRMTRTGRLDTIETHRVSFGTVKGLPTSLDEGLDGVAIARKGGMYVSGFNGWAIWHVAPNGAATYVGYDRGSGGTSPDLASGPGGAVFAENDGTIVRLTPTSLVPVVNMVKVQGQYFSGTYFAFGPSGIVYVDETPGNVGFEARQELVSRRGSQTKVLWREPKSAAERHIQ